MNHPEPTKGAFKKALWVLLGLLKMAAFLHLPMHFFSQSARRCEVPQWRWGKGRQNDVEGGGGGGGGGGRCF